MAQAVSAKRTPSRHKARAWSHEGASTTLRFAVAFGLTAAYVAFAVWASSPWRAELRDAIGPVMSWVIPIFLAYVPAVLVGFMVFTLITLRYRVPSLNPPSGPWPQGEWPPVTVVVAARDEESAIAPTLERIADLSYGGPLTAILADNNSTDRTAEVAEETARRRGLELRRTFEPEAGKWRALNRALESVETPIMVTVDADTLLHPEALKYLVSGLMREPGGQHVCACAGALVVQSPTRNLLTRMQSWDYRLGINGVKRMQSAYDSTLVAQGAFSAYWVDDVRAVGGWPDAIGEDIVLTWSMMMGSRGLVEYEPCALGATAAPERVSRLMRQRSRWAQGMLEGLQRNPPIKQPRILARFVSGLDYLVPLLDFGYVFFWIPGVVLFIALSWVSSATCSAIGRWSRQLRCAATRNTWPGRHDVGNSGRRQRARACGQGQVTSDGASRTTLEPRVRAEDQKLGPAIELGVAPMSYTVLAMPSKHPRIAVTADPELGEALARVRAATGTREADATLLRRLAVEGAEAELEAGRNRRVAAEALFKAMDSEQFDLDLEAVDRLNVPPAA